MLSGLAPYCTVFVITTTRKLLQTRRKHTHRAVREWGITMTSMREQQTLTEGVTSVVCQCGRFYKKQSRTADSSDKEWLSDV